MVIINRILCTCIKYLITLLVTTIEIIIALHTLSFEVSVKNEKKKQTKKQPKIIGF